MNKNFRLMILAALFCGVLCEGVSAGDKYDLWGSSGEHKVDWHEMDEAQKTFALERYKTNIEYCLEHLGEKYSEVEIKKVGNDKGFKISTPVITYGLVAMKYQDDYNDLRKAAEYFYKDWFEFQKCEAGRSQGGSAGGCVTFGSGPGDYEPLGLAVNLWEEAGMYKEALKHYQEYFDSQIVGRCLMNVPGSREDKLKELRVVLEHDGICREFYESLMAGWNTARKLAKTTKPKPLDPAVQNHEWFYSGKTVEVLKALAYYSRNRVRFMIEKAAKDKRPAISKKAKEYLDSWDNQGVQNRDEESAAGKK